MSASITEEVRDEKTPVQITAIIHDVITSFTDKSAYALNQSRYAPVNNKVCFLFPFRFLVYLFWDPSTF